MNVEVDNRLYNNIVSYCKLNDLNVKEYINMLLKTGFNIDRYGERPPINEEQNNVKETKTTDIIKEEKTEPDTFETTEEKKEENLVDIKEEPKIIKRKLK